jgi:uncharacterized protein YbcV (DUF1398 family)
MFSLTDISAAHSQVRSGADFPTYIQALSNLGVQHYEAFVADGHVDYYGTGDFRVSSPAKYAPLSIAAPAMVDAFRAALLDHQQGQTDYGTFCNDCAASGIAGWTVSIMAMTCTYHDLSGNTVLTEQIPG